MKNGAGERVGEEDDYKKLVASTSYFFGGGVLKCFEVRPGGRSTRACRVSLTYQSNDVKDILII